MTGLAKALALCCCLVFPAAIATAQTADKPAKNLALGQHIERGARVYIAPMDGFEDYLTAALLKKKVPLIVVPDKATADYVIAGQSHLEKAGWAKTIFITGAPAAGASVEMKSARTGELVWAYSVDKFAAARANQSTAEAIAKHLKQTIEK